MLFRRPGNTAPQAGTALRGGGSRKGKRAPIPLAFFDPSSFVPSATVPTTPSTVCDVLQAHLPPTCSLVRFGRTQRAAGRGGGAETGGGGALRGVGLLCVNEDFKVLGRFTPPLALLPPPTLPVEGLNIAAYREHVETLRKDRATTFVCATRPQAIGFAFVGTDGREVRIEEGGPSTSSTSLSRSFIADGSESLTDSRAARQSGQHRRQQLEPHVLQRRDGLGTLVSAAMSHRSAFHTEVGEYLDRVTPRLDECHAFAVRREGPMFDRVAGTRRMALRERMVAAGEISDDEADDDEGETRAAVVTTVFDDSRWFDVPLRLMSSRDIAAHRSSDLNMTAVVGCTRFGSLELL